MPTWCARWRAPTCGGGARRSACWSTGGRARRSRRCGRWRRQSPSPLARVHALWTLDGLGALDDASLDVGDAGRHARRARERRRPRRAAPPLVGVARQPTRRDGGRTGRARPLRRPRRARLAGDAGRRRRASHAALRPPRRSVDAAGGPQRRVRRGAGARRRDAARPLAPAGGAVRRRGPRSSASWRRSSGHARRPAEVARILDAVSAARDADAAWWRAALLEGLAQGAQGRRAARANDAGHAAARTGAARRCARPTCAPARSPCCGSRARATTRRGGRRCSARPRPPAQAPMRSGAPTPSRWCRWIARSAAATGWRRFVSPHEPDVVQLAAVTALGRLDPATLAAAGRRTDDAAAARTTRSDASCCRAGPASRPRCGPAPATCSSTTRSARGCWSKRCPRERSSRGAWASGRSRTSCSTRIAAIRAKARAVLEEDPQQARRDGAALRRGPRPGRRSGARRGSVRPHVRRLSPARRHPRRRPRPGPRHGAASSAGEPAGRHPPAEPIDRAALRDLPRRAQERRHGRRPPRRPDRDDDHAAASRRPRARHSARRHRDDGRRAAEHDARRPRDADLAGGRWRTCSPSSDGEISPGIGASPPAPGPGAGPAPGTVDAGA